MYSEVCTHRKCDPTENVQVQEDYRHRKCVLTYRKFRFTKSVPSQEVCIHGNHIIASQSMQDFIFALFSIFNSSMARSIDAHNEFQSFSPFVFLPHLPLSSEETILSKKKPFSFPCLVLSVLC